jgi:hypothetical protein
VLSSTTSRRITRRQAEPRVGATEENAITIDSDSDESSVGDFAVESSSAVNEDQEESSQVRFLSRLHYLIHVPESVVELFRVLGSIGNPNTYNAGSWRVSEH